MSALSVAAADYLRLRNRLGHDLAEYHRLLPRFVAYLDEIGAPTVTIATTLAWSQAPDVDPTGTVGARRMTIARVSPVTWPGSTHAPRSRRPG